MESARDWAGRTIADFSAVYRGDWDDFGAGAEHEEFLKSPEFPFEAGLDGRADGFFVGKREDDAARDTGQDENSEWRSHQVIIFDEQDAGMSAFLKNAIAASPASAHPERTGGRDIEREYLYLNYRLHRGGQVDLLPSFHLHGRRS